MRGVLFYQQAVGLTFCDFYELLFLALAWGVVAGRLFRGGVPQGCSVRSWSFADSMNHVSDRAAVVASKDCCRRN